MATAAAKRYAKAVFELAQDEGGLEKWARRLGQVRELFADPGVAAVLSNPTIPTERREELVTGGLHLLDEEGSNLARLLIESGRIGEAAEIDEEFQRMADEQAGRVRATVTTAIELQSADLERVRNELSRHLAKDVKLSVVVDPRILGGMKLQYGDRVVDASVATRLEQLRRRLAAS
ncbi:MAG TPA: F0F1 ATP synthase subunit delta [Candidatus Dormibacteraeota bacterium]|nr:F0F1 ATP synthase subunit delta [Candidatus Dormibacteraeota bacterium]